MEGNVGTVLDENAAAEICRVIAVHATTAFDCNVVQFDPSNILETEACTLATAGQSTVCFACKTDRVFVEECQGSREHRVCWAQVNVICCNIRRCRWQFMERNRQR